MVSFAEHKVKGGKLVGAFVDCDGTRLKSVRIVGDFFIYPESALSEIEKKLIGAERDSDVKMLSEMIGAAVLECKAELIGVTPDAIAATINKAVKARECSGE